MTVNEIGFGVYITVLLFVFLTIAFFAEKFVFRTNFFRKILRWFEKQ